MMSVPDRRSRGVAELSNGQPDHSAINLRIAAKENAGENRRGERASVKERTRFGIPEARRLYARYSALLSAADHRYARCQGTVNAVYKTLE
jgi:hypothetical protein